MALWKKIAEKQAEVIEKANKKNQRDVFLLWGEYPRGWAMVKDLVLCLFLMNALIGEVKQIDIAALMTPKTLVFVQEARVQTAKAAEIPKEVEAPQTAKNDLVDTIYLKESSRGKNNYSKCEAIGKFNRYGYGIPGNGDYMCFEKDEDTEAVEGWVATNRAIGLTDNQILCKYNTGKATESCAYLD